MGRGDDGAAGKAGLGAAAARLRHVADRLIAAHGRPAQDPDGSAVGRDQAQDGAQERRLSRAVGAEHADEFALLDGEVDVGEHGASAEDDGSTVDVNGCHEAAPASAFSRASSWPSIQPA